MTIGEQVRKKRKAAGMTMAELGKKIGVTAAAISRYELGQRDLTIDTLQSIADALGVHIFDLVDISNKMRQIKLEYVDIKLGPGNPKDLAQKRAEIEKLLSGDPSKMYDELSDSEKREFWNLLIAGRGVPEFSLDSDRERINILLDQMTEEGKRRVINYIEDILPRYRRPQSPADASGNADPPASEKPLARG